MPDTFGSCQLEDRPLMIAVLATTADLMEQDERRCIELYGAPVGQPVSMVDHLIGRACTGPFEEWRAEWVRIVRDEGVIAAAKWSDGQRELRQRAFHLIFPCGIQSPAATAESVRAIAASLSAA
ncbi:hypothetical protein [Streptomyces anulatus]|uniref:hypothetical protein n=1 Tax=Streptomyces anulatus TaxID=1892 RepID=UPI002ED448C4|nr:hypothetical protein OG703_33565 [Streptomyces anulatus]